MARKKTIEDIDVAGKTVLVRVDYNVPFRPGTTQISDDSRIRASLPTLRYLIDQSCRIVACSHLGRPGGQTVEQLRMAPVARRLSELLGAPVVEAPDCVGPEVKEMVLALPVSGVMLLQNLRFHREEEENDPEFAAALASLADVYVNDAFGAAHRSHASTEGVTKYLPSRSGFLMARELEMLGQTLDSPRRPFAAVLGGAKVSDKVAALRKLAPRVDTLIVGGGMAATFLKARGLTVGDSLVEEDQVPVAAELLRPSAEKGPGLMLPLDVVVADAFEAGAAHRVVDVDSVPKGWRIMDIGPRTALAFEQAISQTKTVVWNGPMGVFEWAAFAQGTIRIANALADLRGATTVVGGGSTVEAVASLGLTSRMTHVSTGGGASLELLEGKVLPGVAALMDKDKPSSA